MIVFNKENITKESFYIATEHIHDAYFDTLEYNVNERYIFAKLVNLIENVFVSVKFEQVRLVFGHNMDKWGKDNQISTLAIQDSFDMGEEIDIEVKCDIPDGYMLFVFEMFSGNHVWIMCKSVVVDVYDADKAYAF